MTVHSADDAVAATAHRHKPTVAVLCVVIPIVLFIVSQVLINFTSVLNGFVVGPISWAMLVAVGQFALAIVGGMVYLQVEKHGSVDESPVADAKEGVR